MAFIGWVQSIIHVPYKDISYFRQDAIVMVHAVILITVNNLPMKVILMSYKPVHFETVRSVDMIFKLA